VERGERFYFFFLDLSYSYELNVFELRLEMGTKAVPEAQRYK